MKIKTLLLIIFMCFVTGCYDYNELNELAIANGIAIDIKDDKYLVSILIANSHKDTADSEKNQATISLFQGEGNSIDEAITNLELTLPKKLYLGHVNIILLSNEYAKKGIEDLFDYVMRKPELLKKMYMAVTKDVEAYKILSTLSPLEMFSSNNIISNIEISNIDIGNTYNVIFSGTLIKYLEKGYEFVLPTLSLTGEKEEANKEENITDPIAKSHLIVLPLSLFKDDKLLLESNEKANKGINILLNKVKNLKMNETDFSATLNNIKCNLKFKLKDNKPIFYLDIKFKYNINSLNKDIDISKEKNQKEITNTINNNIKRYINEAINLITSNDVDAIGFGNLIYKNNPNYYNKIKDNYLKLLDFKIKVDGKLEVTGELKSLRRN